MGRRGPPKKPTALKIAGVSHRRENAYEPKPEEGAPAPWSGLNDDAKAVYGQLIDTLRPLGVVTVSDGLMLSMLAAVIEGYIRCSKVIDERGMTVMGQNGEKTRPEAIQLHRFRDSILRIAGKFGLSPSDRASLVDVNLLAGDRERREQNIRFFGHPG